MFLNMWSVNRGFETSFNPLSLHVLETIFITTIYLIKQYFIIGRILYY